MLVALKPRWGAPVVAAWLFLIIMNLVSMGSYLDVALRDLGLALGALGAVAAVAGGITDRIGRCPGFLRFSHHLRVGGGCRPHPAQRKDRHGGRAVRRAAGRRGEGGKITAVGRDADVLKERGARTRVIDLKGRTVLPGLFDSHVHALEAGLSEFRAPLPALDSIPAVQAYLRERARSTPKGEWIVVPRTFPTRLTEMQMPTREVLDVVPDHPVMFDASYVVIANSMALRGQRDHARHAESAGRRDRARREGRAERHSQERAAAAKGVPRAAAGFTETDRLQALEDQLKRYVAAGSDVGQRPRRGRGADRALSQAEGAGRGCRSASR